MLDIDDHGSQLLTIHDPMQHPKPRQGCYFACEVEAGQTNMCRLLWDQVAQNCSLLNVSIATQHTQELSYSHHESMHMAASSIPKLSKRYADRTLLMLAGMQM